MNLLRTYRRTWGLTQEQVAFLLGYADRGPIPFYEADSRRISLANALGYSILFDVPISDLVPDVTTEVSETILRQAGIAQLSVAERATKRTKAQRELLMRIARRVRTENGSYVPPLRE